MWLKTVGLVVMLTLSILVVPRTADAQAPTKVHRIGWLSAGSPSPSGPGLAPGGQVFKQGLRDLGYVEGQNIAIEYRYADNKYDRLPDLAAELVRLPVDVIVAWGSNAARAAQQATRTIPIVLVAGVDPVRLERLAGLARPGGNITGPSAMSAELGGKRLELLKEAVPTASRVAVLFNSASLSAVHQLREMEGAARSLGVQLHALEVRHADELERAFATATREGAGALIVLRNFLMTTHRPRILHLATKSRLPSMYEQREFVDAGGLMSYGPSLDDLSRRAAIYVDKILKGAKPADLPVEQPMKFELVINLKAAQAIGLTIPPSVLFQADEVIK